MYVCIFIDGKMISKENHSIRSCRAKAGTKYGTSCGSRQPFHACCSLKQPRHVGESLQPSAYTSVHKRSFEGGRFIRTLPTALLQFSGKIILNSQVIVKSVIDLADNFECTSSINGETKHVIRINSTEINTYLPM